MAQNNLAITLQQLDNNSIILARRSESFSYGSPIFGEWRVGNLPTTGATSISLVGNAAQPLQVMIKNTTLVASTITVIWTPTTGSSATVIVLGVGDMIAFWQTSTAATYGISALSLTASVANTAFELFIGG